MLAFNVRSGQARSVLISVTSLAYPRAAGRWRAKDGDPHLDRECFHSLAVARH
jgi:hypothetical protein